MVDWRVVLAVAAALLIPFVVVPAVLERLGRNPRGGSVRAAVWLAFLVLLLVPAALTGFLARLAVADWVVLGFALAIAILYDYYRLNPEKFPWRRAPR